MIENLFQKRVKTKKEHRCWGCLEKFLKGSMMTVNSSVDSGQFNRVYFCDSCIEYLEKHKRENNYYSDGIDLGFVKESKEYE